jgi:hypothetical protein
VCCHPIGVSMRTCDKNWLAFILGFTCLVDMDIVGYYYLILWPILSINNPSNIEMFFCENMKLSCWQPSQLSPSRIYIISLVIWQYCSRSWNDPHLFILSMWKLTLGYSIGDALILGLRLVSKFKKIPIPCIC